MLWGTWGSRPAIPVSKLGASQPEVVLPDRVTSPFDPAKLNVFASYLELSTGCQHPRIPLGTNGSESAGGSMET